MVRTSKILSSCFAELFDESPLPIVPTVELDPRTYYCPPVTLYPLIYLLLLDSPIFTLVV